MPNEMVDLYCRDKPLKDPPLLGSCKGDLTRDDSQRRSLAQHSVAALLRHCFELTVITLFQHCNSVLR